MPASSPAASTTWVTPEMVSVGFGLTWAAPQLRRVVGRQDQLRAGPGPCGQQLRDAGMHAHPPGIRLQRPVEEVASFSRDAHLGKHLPEAELPAHPGPGDPRRFMPDPLHPGIEPGLERVPVLPQRQPEFVGADHTAEVDEDDPSGWLAHD
jgi:hypothetical protein